MSKMIPNYIDQEDPRRNGERLVFELFSDEKIKGTTFYSMPQINHRHLVDYYHITFQGVL